MVTLSILCNEFMHFITVETILSMYTQTKPPVQRESIFTELKKKRVIKIMNKQSGILKKKKLYWNALVAVAALAIASIELNSFSMMVLVLLL